MIIFQVAKEAVSAKDAASFYGIKVGRNGMACCPFHSDKHPSMKIDKRFHCFGCRADGDVIDFVSGYFGLPVKDAAIKICQDFGLTHDTEKQPKRIRAKPKKTPEQIFREAEKHTTRVLTDYLKLLKEWKTKYAPKDPGEAYHLDGGFIPEKEFCSNRLPVNYNPDAPSPNEWLKFLHALLYEEDIPTVQEFIGYLFLPTTKAQTMLMLIGTGGEGKSRVGFVLRRLLEDNMNVCSLSKLSGDRFCPADQKGKLLMLDDDMRMEALTDTGMLKAIVTMEDKMDLERKGKQSYQGYLYVRLMAFGNGALSSLYDKSEGFYRRQIVIKVKEKPADRVDDRFLSEKLARETESIALWGLEGIKRLVANDFHFTISERTRKNLEEMRREEDSILDFLESKGYIAFSPEAMCTTRDFYDAYRMWCDDNLIKPRSETSFSKEIKERAGKLGIVYMKNVPSGTKSARGYKGVYALHPLENCPFPYR